MKKSRFSDSQIMQILKQVENRVPVVDLCREHGIGNATFTVAQQVQRHGRLNDCEYEDVGNREQASE